MSRDPATAAFGIADGSRIAHVSHAGGSLLASRGRMRASVLFVPNEARNRYAKARLIGIPDQNRTGVHRMKICCPIRLDDGNLFATFKL
jgi:hypothetical protein